MKLGTFVGKELVKLSDSEVKYVCDTVKQVMQNNYPDIAYELKIDKNLVNGFFTLHIFDGITNYRDYKGNLVKPDYISLYMVKSRGYDEAVNGKFYEWPDGYKPDYDIESYSVTIDIMGSERQYRKKTVCHHIGLYKTMYTYGTGLIDLELDKSLRKIMDYVKNLQKVKNNII